MSLYLKYRSKTFDDLVEQEYSKSIIKKQVLQSHQGEQFSNYLLYGSRGIGKTSVARIMARAFNCTNTADGNPCNSCESCQLIIDNKAMDILEIDAASHTWVDNIREEIIWKAIYGPVQLRKKIIIIDEVHMLSGWAFNALLKIMEEPPSYLVFILATTELHKLPETILSRCQLFSFKRITVPWIVARLSRIAEQESIKCDQEWLTMIAKLADGGMRDAIKYFDQVSILGNVDAYHVWQCLWVTSESTLKKFIDLYTQKDTAWLLDLVSTLQDGGIDIFVFLKELLSYIDRTLTGDSLWSWSELVQFVKRCYEKLKYFPHPYVLLKSEIALLSSPVTQSPPVVPPVVQPSPTPVTPPSTTTPHIQTVQTPQIEEDHIKKQDNVPTTDNDYHDLKERIVRSIGSQSVKWIREQSCHIDQVDDHRILVQVIEKGKLTLLVLPKNQQEIDHLCSEILGKTMFVEYQFIDKEDFLKKWLGWLA